MKVLYVTNMYPVVDYIYFGIHVKEQIEALKLTKGVQSDIYFVNGRESKLNYIKSIFEINALIKSNHYDIVHVHFGLSGLFLLFSANLIVPTVLTIHGSDINSGKMGGVMKLITKAVVKKVNYVIVMNDKMAAKIDKDKNHVIKLPCGIDTNLFKETGVAKTSGAIIIGFPGNRARPEKNFELFSEIVKQLRNFIDVEVVEFHNMTRQEVVHNLNKIDMLILTSLSEGSPQVVKEAMSCNKPVISSDVGDVKDLLDGVANSYVMNSFDPLPFVQAALKIINLPAEQRNSNGHEKLQQLGLDSRSVSEKLYHIYQELSPIELATV